MTFLYRSCADLPGISWCVKSSALSRQLVYKRILVWGCMIYKVANYDLTEIFGEGTFAIYNWGWNKVVVDCSWLLFHLKLGHDLWCVGFWNSSLWNWYSKCDSKRRLLLATTKDCSETLHARFLVKQTTFIKYVALRYWVPICQLSTILWIHSPCRVYYIKYFSLCVGRPVR